MIFTEGYKKSLALLSHGYVAVSLRGACRAFSAKQGLDSLSLSDEMKEILSWRERPIYIAYDTDTNAGLRKSVQTYAYNLGAFIKEGSYASEIKMIDLPLQKYKAVDDYIHKHGADAFRTLYENAI